MSMPPPASGAIVSGIAGVLVLAARDERVVALRRGALARRAPVVEARALTFPRAVPVAFRVLVAARRVVLAARRVVLAARRRVEVAPEPAPLIACRACLVRPSILLRTLFTSARVLAFLACACSCLMAARAV